MATIAVTGSTGLIGSALVEDLRGDGHRVVRVVRPGTSSGADRDDTVEWDPDAGTIDAAKLEGVDAVVHLAGEPIGAARWTAEVRERIARSRQVGTRVLAGALAGLSDGPRVLVSGSAVGVYGDRDDERLTEASAPGDDFLAKVCVAWEAAAAPAREAGLRVVHPRTGVVIAREGPLIEKVERPFRMGIGGRVGSGRQYVPWISLRDEVRALRHLIDTDLEGPVNLVAPEQATNRDLTRELGRVLRRPTVLPIPTFAIGLLYGRMGITLATSSQRVVPDRLAASGFEWVHASLGAALDEALGDQPA